MLLQAAELAFLVLAVVQPLPAGCRNLRKMLAVLRNQGSQSNTAGNQEKTSCLSAALGNGLAHVVELDDVHRLQSSMPVLLLFRRLWL